MELAGEIVVIAAEAVQRRLRRALPASLAGRIDFRAPAFYLEDFDDATLEGERRRRVMERRYAALRGRDRPRSVVHVHVVNLNPEAMAQTGVEPFDQAVEDWRRFHDLRRRLLGEREDERMRFAAVLVAEEGDWTSALLDRVRPFHVPEDAIVPEGTRCYLMSRLLELGDARIAHARDVWPVYLGGLFAALVQFPELLKEAGLFGWRALRMRLGVPPDQLERTVGELCDAFEDALFALEDWAGWTAPPSLEAPSLEAAVAAGDPEPWHAREALHRLGLRASHAEVVLPARARADARRELLARAAIRSRVRAELGVDARPLAQLTVVDEDRERIVLHELARPLPAAQGEADAEPAQRAAQQDEAGAAGVALDRAFRTHALVARYFPLPHQRALVWLATVLAVLAPVLAGLSFLAVFLPIRTLLTAAAGAALAAGLGPAIVLVMLHRAQDRAGCAGRDGYLAPLRADLVAAWNRWLLSLRARLAAGAARHRTLHGNGLLHRAEHGVGRRARRFREHLRLVRGQRLAERTRLDALAADGLVEVRLPCGVVSEPSSGVRAEIVAGAVRRCLEQLRHRQQQDPRVGAHGYVADPVIREVVEVGIEHVEGRAMKLLYDDAERRLLDDMRADSGMAVEQAGMFRREADRISHDRNLFSVDLMDGDPLDRVRYRQGFHDWIAARGIQAGRNAVEDDGGLGVGVVAEWFAEARVRLDARGRFRVDDRLAGGSSV